MKKQLLYLLIPLLAILASCNNNHEEKSEKGFNIIGAWSLIRVDYPNGTSRDYSKATYTRCKIYDADSTYYSIQLQTTGKDVFIIPNELAQYSQHDTTYIENGRHTPFRIINDSTMATVWDGYWEIWRKVKTMSETRKEEIRNIVRINLEYNSDGRIKTQYILSTSEKELRQVNHVFLLAIVILIFGIAFLAYYVHNVILRKRELEQKLKDIAEEQALRPAPLQNALKEVEQTFFQSEYYQDLYKKILTGGKLNPNEWTDLEQQLKVAFPGFTSKLHSLHKLSEIEYRVCLLLKIKISPNEMATLLNKSQSAISSIRSRLYQKVFGKKGGAKDWDTFILSL